MVRRGAVVVGAHGVDAALESGACHRGTVAAKGETLVFTRPLGIKKNSVVLPRGYELTGVNYPSQVRQEADGRIQVSFINIGSAQVPYVVRARKLK